MVYGGQMRGVAFRWMDEKGIGGGSLNILTADWLTEGYHLTE